MRTAALIAALAREHDVELISFCERTPADSEMEAAKTVCAAVQVEPYAGFAPASWQARLRYLSPQPRSVGSTYSAAFAERVRQTIAARRPAVIIAGQIDMAPYALESTGIPLILEELELGSRFAQAGEVDLRGRLSLWKLRNYVQTILPRFSAVTVVSAQEAVLVQSVAPNYAGRLTVLPNGATLPELATPGARVPRPGMLLYTGAVTYSANLDAVRYFSHEILPLIRRDEPYVRLRVTGRTDGVDLSGMASEIEFCGYLPSLAALLQESWAMAVPLREGGGTRLKVLEALANGLPVISTSKGIEGLDLEPGRDVLTGETPEEFAAATMRLLHDPALRAELAANGRRAAQAYDWETITPGLLELVGELTKAEPQTRVPAPRPAQGALA